MGKFPGILPEVGAKKIEETNLVAKGSLPEQSSGTFSGKK